MNQINQKLFEIAEEQQGFFTSKQAVLCGYSPSAQSYHVKAKNWVREYRGIFRLANFPYSSQTQFVVMSLWTMNRDHEIEGVYSHETALVLHDVSDANPSRIYMIVPKHFRRHSAPPYQLELFKQSLKEDEVVNGQGYKFTNPLRTVLDLIASKNIEERIILQAIQDFYQRGDLVRSDLQMIGDKSKSFVVKKYLEDLNHA